MKKTAINYAWYGISVNAYEIQSCYPYFNATTLSFSVGTLVELMPINVLEIID